jgi:hypothetical protein
MTTLFPFMRLQGEQTHITEEYVSSPPALMIIDERGAVWTLGFTRATPRESDLQQKFRTNYEAPRGEFAFNVLRNGQNVGEFASRIERRRGKVRILTATGWKVWTGTAFV